MPRTSLNNLLNESNELHCFGFEFALTQEIDKKLSKTTLVAIFRQFSDETSNNEGQKL